MNLLQSVHKQCNDQLLAETFLLEYINVIENSPYQLTFESVNGTLDRIEYMINKHVQSRSNSMSDRTKSTIGRTLTALLLLKKNVATKHGDRVKDLLKRQGVDFNTEMDHVFPGALKNNQHVVNQIIKDIDSGAKETTKLIGKLRALGNMDFSDSRNPIRRKNIL